MPFNHVRLILEDRNLLSGPESSKCVYHLTFRSDQALTYQPSDHFVIRPPNSHVLVKSYLKTVDNKAVSSEEYDFVRWGPLDLSKQHPRVKGGFKRMHKRYYSIASTARTSCHHLELLIRHIGACSGEPLGVASSYLCEEIQVGDEIEAELFSSSFHDVDFSSSPTIFIASGVGIASFRGIILDRAKRQQKTWLFFGDRDETQDFLYQKTWKQLIAFSPLKVSTAFSRKSLTHTKRLQNLLEEESSLLWNWMKKEETFLFIAGSIAMGKAALTVLKTIAQDIGKDPNWINRSIVSGHLRYELY